MKTVIIAILLVFLSSLISLGQQKATIKEYTKEFETYPFSDPDPIPEFGKVYPYFRFDGYSDKSIKKAWKVVELENEYIKVMIMPEIGGKIWNAVEKSTGKSFIYNNHVVKFRDVAMRGPWTSGGIEANYGIIGHTPNVATPVDYTLITKSDGSVSCVIGILDLLTRSTWRVDINLPKDKAYFTTGSFWYNSSAIEQPYYSWMNVGIKADGNLQFIFPGTKHIGHSGENSSWPVDKESGIDLSFYKNNNFGGPKSYHVFGMYTDFYANYWHDDDFGMGRYSQRNDKAGKKIWIWGLAPQGMIWEKLLTDTDGQYVEVQSGRLFNQESPQSTYTPFKHKGFAPFSTDTWTETWFPVVKTKGIVAANNYGSLNIKKENDWLKIYFSPLQPINDDLKITVDNKVVFSRLLKLKPLELFKDSIRLTNAPGLLTATIGENKLKYSSSPTADVLSRPVESPADFDWQSAYGLYVLGKEDIKQKFYVPAESKLRESLAKNPNYVPALTDLAMLLYRRMQYDEALDLAKKALSINTYDAAANYYYGLINMKSGKIADAKDGLEIASMGMEYRSAAYTLLASLYLKEKEYEKSIEYANRSIDFNRYAMDAYQLLAANYRLLNRKQEAAKVLDTVLKFDPLNHFARFEKYLLNNSQESKNYLTSLIRNEMPHETFLELAIWYNNKGLKEEANQVLDLSPDHTVVSYWKAALQNKPLPESDIKPNLVFPFRPETKEIIEQLIEKNDHWQLKYHLALIHWNFNNMDKVQDLFDQIGNKPTYAPYYAARAKLNMENTNSSAVLADLQKAAELDKNEWRYGESLVNYYISQNEPEEALQLITAYYRTFPQNYVLGTLKARALMLNKKHNEAKQLLQSIVILPNEGATRGRELYKEALLRIALTEMKKGNYKNALTEISQSRLWPDNLGVGKPYESDIDERIEDWLAYESYVKLNNDQSKAMLDKILSYNIYNQDNTKIRSSANNLITAWALQKNGKPEEAESLLKRWLAEEPGNATASWANKVYRGEITPLEKQESMDVNYRLLQVFTSRL